MFLIQPLNRGIMKAFKVYYMRELYRKVCEALGPWPLPGNHHDGLLEVSHHTQPYWLCWHSLGQHEEGYGWKNVGPGVTENIKKSVKTTCILHGKCGEGFSDLKKEEMEEILAEKAVELTTKIGMRWQNKACHGMWE